MARHLYLAALPQFLNDASDPAFADRLSSRLAEVDSRAAGDGERTAWLRSLPALADVLRRPEFAASRVFVELFMPLSSQRCDVLLTGHTPSGPSAVVVELKQWTFFKPSVLEEHVSVGGEPRLHPCIQVRDYVDTLKSYHSAFTGAGESIGLSGVAYLHDMDPVKGAALRDPRFGGVHLDFPLFFQREQAAFAQWLSQKLVPGPGDSVAERIRLGRPAPSTKLLDLVVETVKGTHQWKLLDQQKTAHFAIRHAVQMAKDGGEKKVIIVRGGPGTGKSVIALQLLADAARQHWAVAHATGSKAFQTVLQGITMQFAEDKLKQIHNVRTKKALPVKHLFTTFSEIARVGAATPELLDLTVCDEAHRLWLFRQSKYGTKIIQLSDRSMVQEVIAASRVTAFFLDDNQSVRSGEIGHSDLIEQHAEFMGVPWERFELDAQFRCAGSESYIRWVEGVLGMRNGLDLGWRDNEIYTVRVWDDMPRMDGYLRALRAQGQRCRLLAGFCWRWNKPDGLGKLPVDLRDKRFGHWAGSWIEKGEQDAAPREHRYYRWATMDELYEEVGSIYSVQGFEFDAIGVIWGEDLVWRDGRWVAQLEHNKDGTFKQELRTSGEDPVAKLLNVYRVLLTRGMRETHLFVLDDETRAHVQACLSYVIPMAAVAGVRSVRESPSPQSSSSKILNFPEPGRFKPRPSAHGFPVLDLQAAAGAFGPEQVDLDEIAHADDRIIWDDAPDVRPGYFVARVTGRSMLPLIDDGAWCLFRASSLDEAGMRPMLVRLVGQAEATSRFTVKDVRVEWSTDEDELQICSALVLKPRNQAYPVMRVEGEQLADVRVVAELVEVLGA